ncbi:MAG: transglutaminase-like cysteine peptidase [Tardiphaga sp.]
MRNLTSARGWRATVVACSLWLAGRAGAAPMVPFQVSDLLRAAEPFARTATTLPEDNKLSEKWRGVERQIDDEMLVLALCEEDRSRCGSPAAQKFLDIVAAGRAKDGRARAGEINRAFNLAIRPGNDIDLYGATDVWRAPLALLSTGAGDCEDYAIAKFVALRAAGVAVRDLRLVIMRDTLRHEDHAMASVRLDGRWWLLDNRRMAMVEDVQLSNHQPLFVLDAGGVRHYRDASVMAGAQIRMPEPAELLKLTPRVK